MTIHSRRGLSGVAHAGARDHIGPDALALRRICTTGLWVARRAPAVLVAVGGAKSPRLDLQAPVLGAVGVAGSPWLHQACGGPHARREPGSKRKLRGCPAPSSEPLRRFSPPPRAAGGARLSSQAGA
jgi:hypothetical protein